MKLRHIAAAIALALTGAAFAQTPAAAAPPRDPAATPRIDQRQVTQEKRIQQGVASGQLTPVPPVAMPCCTWMASWPTMSLRPSALSV